MARPKSKRNIQALNLSIDKDILEEARLTIDNMSLFVEACLKRHIDSENKRKEASLRIMDIQSSDNKNYNNKPDVRDYISKEEEDLYFDELFKSFADENYKYSDNYYLLAEKYKKFTLAYDEYEKNKIKTRN